MHMDMVLLEWVVWIINLYTNQHKGILQKQDPFIILQMEHFPEPGA
jgi:hypothetical protein